jgi:hypothetical protein
MQVEWYLNHELPQEMQIEWTNEQMVWVNVIKLFSFQQLAKIQGM